MRIKNIALEKLHISDLNIRKNHHFGDENDEEFISNMKSIGILQPIVVRPNGEQFEILIGRRRYLSAKQQGLDEIPCIVKDLDEDEAIDASISENIFRKKVDPVTLGMWIKKRLAQGDISLSQYAKKIGKSKSTLSEWVRMNDLTQDLKAEVQRGSVPFNYALKVARMNLSPEDEIKLAEESREAGFDAFKEAVDRMKSNHEKRGAPKGLQIIRINFGMDSSDYSELVTLSGKSGMDLGDYCLSILREHVKSPNLIN
jgi:ParB family chromosome partitioning protein